jgi:uncharacterized protein YqgC (DUF456 family)
MLDIILIILGVLCLITGLMGCILPFLPGPPVAYLGLVLLHFTDKVQYTTTQLIVWLLIVLVVQVLDYFTPMLGSKYSGGSRWGNWGCIIGTLIGLLFLPWGVIFGPFLGAVIGIERQFRRREAGMRTFTLLGNKEFSQALRSGVGSLIGFLLGTFLKFVVCGYFCYQFIVGFIRS